MDRNNHKLWCAGVVLAWLLLAGVLCLPPLLDSLRRTMDALQEHNANLNEEIRKITH